MEIKNVKGNDVIHSAVKNLGIYGRLNTTAVVSRVWACRLSHGLIQASFIPLSSVLISRAPNVRPATFVAFRGY